MKIKFRATMLAILLTLVAATVTLLGVNSYSNARFTADELSAQILDQTSLRIQAEVKRLVSDGAGLNDLHRRLLQSGQLHADDFPQLIAYWREVMEGHPELTSMWIGLEASGECTGISRLNQGKLSVWESRQNAQTDQLEVREYWATDYPERPYLFDPAKRGPDIRTRPWYQAAAKGDRGRWTETYVWLGFEGLQQPHGLTHAAPVHAVDGSLAAVVSADFELGELCRFLQRVPVGKSGFAFIVERPADGSHRVIAHPQQELLLAKAEGGSEGELTPVESFADRRVPAFMQHIPDSVFSEQAGSIPIRFEEDGVRYFGDCRFLKGEGSPPWLICMVVPQADVLGGVQKNNRQTLALGGGILLVAILLSLYVSAQVARPLERIASETQAIGRLQIDERPVVHSIVMEVDRLAVATEEMKLSLRSFQKFVPADLVRGMLETGQEAKRGGERRRLTISFCDIKDFSTIAEQLPAEELVEQLGEYLEALSGAVQATGGTVDKYIGDAVMAFWNAPGDHPLPALSACTAAIRGQQRLARLRTEWQAAGRPLFYVRHGINTGEVIVGNMGSVSRLNYTAVGDPVNLASRLEGLNKHYGTQILISETTYEQVKHDVVARPIDWVSVKGKTKGVLVYELLHLKQDVNGELDEMIEYYASALSSYRQQDWNGAITLFEHVLRLRPADRPAEQMIARCRSYEASPPGAQWDGVHRMESK